MAANWSLLFTPILGAYLHALNWRALGHPRRAAASIAWVWATVVFLAVNIGTLFLVDSKEIDTVIKVGGLGLLFGWYFTMGRSQVRYVRYAFADSYVKRSWGAPLGLGLVGVSAYLVVAWFLGTVFYSPDPNSLAANMKPLILQEWYKRPELVSATIQKVTLVHKQGKLYTGFIDATLAGRPERLALEVIYDRGTVIWQLKALN